MTWRFTGLRDSVAPRCSSRRWSSKRRDRVVDHEATVSLSEVATSARKNDSARARCSPSDAMSDTARRAVSTGESEADLGFTSGGPWIQAHRQVVAAEAHELLSEPRLQCACDHGLQKLALFRCDAVSRERAMSVSECSGPPEIQNSRFHVIQSRGELHARVELSELVSHLFLTLRVVCR